MSTRCIAIPPMLRSEAGAQMTRKLAGALLLATVTAAWCHQLDEYLQGTLLSIEDGRILVQMRLTPVVEVLPIVLTSIDSDRHGILSQAEQSGYTAKLLR